MVSTYPISENNSTLVIWAQFGWLPPPYGYSTLIWRKKLLVTKCIGNTRGTRVKHQWSKKNLFPTMDPRGQPINMSPDIAARIQPTDRLLIKTETMPFATSNHRRHQLRWRRCGVASSKAPLVRRLHRDSFPYRISYEIFLGGAARLGASSEFTCPYYVRQSLLRAPIIPAKYTHTHIQQRRTS